MRTPTAAIAVAATALLLGSASAVRADSISPNVRPVSIGGSSEPSLSSVLGCVFFGGPACDPATTLLTYDVIANENAAGLWSLGGTGIVTLNYQYTGNDSSIGVWSPTDSGINTLQLFDGSAKGENDGGPASTTITPASLAGGGINPSSFGFYITTPGGNTFYSIDSLNPSGEAHALSFTDGNDNWALAFEDQRLYQSDLDYNDEVLTLTDPPGAPNNNGSPVPEPASIVLLGTGLVGVFGRLRHAVQA